MSYIALSRRDIQSPHEVTVCITDSEAAILLPYIEDIYKKEDKKYRKYLDIHEIGEATTAQQYKMIYYKERVESLGSLIFCLSERIERWKKTNAGTKSE